MDTPSMTSPRTTSDGRLLTLPNMLSFGRLATVPVFLWLFLSGREDAAVIVYAVAAWTDFFDGYIARRTHSVTELGKLLDPLADRVFIVALALALVARRALPWWLAAIVVGRDLLVLSLFPVLERRKVQRIQVNFVGKVATAALLAGLTLLALSETSFPGAAVGDEIGIVVVSIGAALYWAAAYLYGKEALGKLRSARSVAG
jgi:cardiolipin synthase (CMP-forming)